jgi:hypothetical protein
MAVTVARWSSAVSRNWLDTPVALARWRRRSFLVVCVVPRAGRVEKPAEVEESKSPPKSEHSAKGAANAGRFFMKFRGPQALPNRPGSKNQPKSKKAKALRKANIRRRALPMRAAFS